MELAFEKFQAALESTRGTTVDPTHFFGWTGSISPMQDYAVPEEARGMLFDTFSEIATRQRAEWSVEGPARPRYMPFWLNLITGPGVITTPTDATLTRDHTHKPSGIADTVKTASLWWGDANVQQYSAPFGYISDWSLSSDTSGTDLATFSASGGANYWAKDSATDATYSTGSFLVPARAQVWLDTSSAIGTTLLSLRAISTEIRGTTGITNKWFMAGTALNYAKIGRGKMAVSASVTVEVPDTTELDLMDAGTTVKLRCRLNGDVIETGGVGPTTFTNSITWDIYGKLKFDSWSDLESSNRLVTFTVTGTYDSTLGAPFQVVVRNSSATV